MTPNAHSMWRSWLILGILIGMCMIIAVRQGGMGRVGEALGSGARLFLTVLPNLLLGFALAGFLQVLLPSELIVKMMGSGSGFKGLLAGTVAGMLTPGGSFTQFPILASLLAKGAAVGPVCAYIAAWALLGLNHFVVWELPILGSRIALARLVSSLWVPPLVGWLGSLLYRAIRLP